MRLALPLVLVTPCMVAACAADRDPDASVQASGDHDAGPDAGPRAIAASLEVTSPSCTRPIVAGYAVRARYTDDNAEVANLRCRVTFANGSTSEACAGEQVVEMAGDQDFIVDVEDLDTGATAHLVQRGFVYPVMEIDFDVQAPSCGLAFDFDIAVPASTGRTVLLSPFENVVDYDGGPWTRDGHVDVTAAGTYRLDAFLEQARSNGPTCSFHVWRDDIVVRDCDHEHTPDCADWP